MPTETFTVTDRYPSAPNFVDYPIVDIIYVNMHAGSDFRIRRGGSRSSDKENGMELELVKLAAWVEKGCFKIVSLNASENSFVAVVSTELSSEQLREKGFPWPKEQSAVSAGDESDDMKKGSEGDVKDAEKPESL